MERKDFTKYLLCGVGGVLLFSLYEIVSKRVVGWIDSCALAFYRFLIGGAILLPFGIRSMRKRGAPFDRASVQYSALFGLILAMSMVVMQYAIERVSAGLFATVWSANSIVVAALSSLFFQEKITKSRVASLAVGLAGIVIASYSGVKYSGDKLQFAIGLVLTAVALLLFCIYTVFGKKYLFVRCGSTASTSFALLFGAAALLALSLGRGAAIGENILVFPFLQCWKEFLYISVGATGLGYLLYFTAIEKLNPTMGSMIFMIKPPVALTLSAIFLQEPLGWQLLLGAALILLSLSIAIRQPAETPGPTSGGKSPGQDEPARAPEREGAAQEKNRS